MVTPTPRKGIVVFFTDANCFSAVYWQAILGHRAGQVIFFETSDLVSTRDWKAVSAALDRNQPTTKFGQGFLNRSENPVTDRSSGIGPMHGIEP